MAYAYANCYANKMTKIIECDMTQNAIRYRRHHRHRRHRRQFHFILLIDIKSHTLLLTVLPLPSFKFVLW